MSGKFPLPEFDEPPKKEKKQEQELSPKQKEVGIESSPPPDRHAKLESTESFDEIGRSTEELRQIEGIRCKLEELKQDQPRQQEESQVIQNPTESVTVRGQQYTVEYVPKEEIYPAFGYGGGDRAIVRQDLSPRVKRFVRVHELYHCQDRAT